MNDFVARNRRTPLLLGAVLALVFANGFFVAAEFAIVKVRASQIEYRVKSGHQRAILAKHIVEHLDSYLSATQLGITLTSLVLGWLGADGDGEWGLALRSAEVGPEPDRLRLFAGCGIVAASDPAAELAESEAKLEPMRHALRTPAPAS